MSEGDITSRKIMPYFTSSLFFNGQQRQDISRLYTFLRTAAAYVDESPQRLGRLDNLIVTWQRLGEAPMRDLEVTEQDDEAMRITKYMARLKIIHGFDVAWVDEFLVTKYQEATPKPPKTLDESLQYVHGSAEVVGRMVASLLRLPKGAHEYAALQARALQWLALVRDIGTDAACGRQHLPQADVKAAGLANLKHSAAEKHPEQFKDFVQLQLGRYYTWQREADAGFAYIPRRARVAAHTAVDVGRYVAKQIAKNPLVVYQQKITPRRSRLIMSAIGHSFD
jgi:phytoene synthase